MPAGFDPESYLTAAAAAIGLEVAPEHRPGVILNLERIAGLAELVMAFPLPEAEEPAPVFRP
jgi:1-carboxybiuret hydrolase subunit AtzG-like